MSKCMTVASRLPVSNGDTPSCRHEAIDVFVISLKPQEPQSTGDQGYRTATPADGVLIKSGEIIPTNEIITIPHTADLACQSYGLFLLCLCRESRQSHRQATRSFLYTVCSNSHINGDIGKIYHSFIHSCIHYHRRRHHHQHCYHHDYSYCCCYYYFIIIFIIMNKISIIIIIYYQFMKKIIRSCADPIHSGVRNFIISVAADVLAVRCCAISRYSGVFFQVSVALMHFILSFIGHITSTKLANENSRNLSRCALRVNHNLMDPCRPILGLK